jgi:hypothetical protein
MKVHSLAYCLRAVEVNARKCCNMTARYWSLHAKLKGGSPGWKAIQRFNTG